MNPHQNLDLLAPGAVRNKFLSEDFVTSPPTDPDTGWPETVLFVLCQALGELFQSQFHSVMGKEGKKSMVV